MDADSAGLAALLEQGDHMELQRLVLEEPPLVRAVVPGYGVSPLCVVCASPRLVPGDALADDLVTCIEVLLAAGANPAQRAARRRPSPSPPGIRTRCSCCSTRAPTRRNPTRARARGAVAAGLAERTRTALLAPADQPPPRFVATTRR